LPPNRDSKARAEQEIFNDLEALCSSAGYVHVLAYFSWRDSFLTYSDAMTAEILSKSYDRSRLIRTELSTLIGLMLKSPVDFGLPDPSTFAEMAERTEVLLEELHQTLLAPMLASFTEDGLVSGVSPFTRADVLREPIFYGGESAYSFQYRDFARERYARDDAWLQAHKGFAIAEAHLVVLTINRLIDRKMLAAVKGLRRDDPSTWTVLPGHCFKADEVVSESGLSVATVEAVLAAFTNAPAPTNTQFETLGDFNSINATPLIAIPGGDYLSLQPYSLVETLYDSPSYWMIADREYRNTASTHRGQFTEEFAARRLGEVFGAENVYCNVDLFESKGQRVGEIDILVRFGDRLIIVQCKSKKLTLEARKGNDLQLQADFKSAVQDAYDQGLKCAKAIEDGSAKLATSDGVELRFPKSREIYICSAVSEHYPALTVQGHQFLKYETSDVIQPPLVSDIFFLDVLAEMLPSPLRFLSYINRRVNYTERVSSINEFAILGLHLKQNLWLEDDLSFAMIDEDVATDLDVSMMVRREGLPGDDTPPGILTRLRHTTVARLISQIEAAREPNLIDLGFLLLSLGENSLRSLSDGIDQITQQTQRDGKQHDVSMSFGNGKSGITVHCSKAPDAEAARTLLMHCERRKYACRAETWFGLVVRAEDGGPEFGVSLRRGWAHDAHMEEITRTMPKVTMASPVGGRLKTRKVGRNEECPCGSTKKFKKCCLP
jgi:hypothetical protein